MSSRAFLKRGTKGNSSNVIAIESFKSWSNISRNIDPALVPESKLNGFVTSHIPSRLPFSGILKNVMKDLFKTVSQLFTYNRKEPRCNTRKVDTLMAPYKVRAQNQNVA